MGDNSAAQAEVVQEGEVELAPQAEQTGLAVPTEVVPNTLLVLPTTGRPFFPVQTAPIALPEAPWIETMQKVAESVHHLVALVMLKDGAYSNDPKPEDFHSVGSAARVHHAAKDSANLQFIAEGQRRVRIVRWLTTERPYLAQVEYLDDQPPRNDQETKAYSLAIMALIKELIPNNPLYGEELKQFLNKFSPTNDTTLADFAATITTASGQDLQAILELTGILERLQRVHELLRAELEVAKIHTRIRAEVEEKMGEQQRRFFLQEQLKVNPSGARTVQG